MKLPSGREIPNDVLADIIDFWVLDAMQTESLDDAESDIGNCLAEGAWGEEGGAEYTEEDIAFILQELTSIVRVFYNDLWAAYGEFHVRYVHSKYPHEG